MKRDIRQIQDKTHAFAVVPNKPRIAYNSVNYLNPSSIVEGLVDHIEIDPNAIKWSFENPDRKPVTAAAQDRMDRGTLAHMMLLEPDRLAKDVAIWEGEKRFGGEWNDFSSMAVDKLIIKSDDYDAVASACKVFRTNKRFNQIVTDLDAEVAMFSKEHSFCVKGLIDAVTNGDECSLIDLKTTEAGISYKSVETTMRNFRNREKMAAYKRWFERESGRTVAHCYNLFLSMIEPYAIRVVEMTTDAEEWGEERIVAALDSVQRCLDANEWPLFVADDMAMVATFERDDEIDADEETESEATE